MKDKLTHYNATHSIEEITKLVTGPKYYCKLTVVSSHAIKKFCYWLAESPQAIIEQLGKLNDFYQKSDIEECEEIINFSGMSED